VLSRDNPELAERFAVIGSGEAECKSCQYTYSPKMGDASYPVSKGTLFEARRARQSSSRLPSELLSRAGSAGGLALPHLRRGEEAVRLQSHQGCGLQPEPGCGWQGERVTALLTRAGYGMGANSMTAEQKSLLIYGALA
jgi:hypothetical protein